VEGTVEALETVRELLGVELLEGRGGSGSAGEANGTSGGFLGSSSSSSSIAEYASIDTYACCATRRQRE